MGLTSERMLAVIPARGGSKGIPKKNIQLINGKPLLLYAIDALKASEVNLDIAVSSDSEDILEVASMRKGVYALQRPPEMAVDTAKTEDALIDALNQMAATFDKDYTSIFTVQPTSPFRKAETIRQFAEHWQRVHVCGKYDAMLTLHATYSDYWIYENEEYSRLYPNAPRRRQERKPLYVENSCLYVTDVDALRVTNSVLGTKVTGFLIDEREALDINEPIDLEIARMVSEISNCTNG